MKEAYEKAKTFVGLKEAAGKKHNPVVVAMFADVGHPQIKDDETSWCAAFVGHVLKSVGLPHTGSLAARSYLKWGQEIALKDALPGDIVVFWRVSKSSWQGHVGFFHRVNGTNIEVLGGNQSNAVNISRYPTSQLLGIRRMYRTGSTQKPAQKPAQKVSILNQVIEFIRKALRGAK